MRGKRASVRGNAAAGRITPAHAGKTGSFRLLPRCSADHPRACGENFAVLVEGYVEVGSPPRMRGKLLSKRLKGTLLRITPAHAGKTKADRERSLAISDHPRACGENSRISHRTAFATGSPPRMRGKPVFQCDPYIVRRITPAHAGKTSRPSPRKAYSSDHPRACGENLSVSSGIQSIHGSPPRMRGKRPLVTVLSLRDRITPAHAGKTRHQTGN